MGFFSKKKAQGASDTAQVVAVPTAKDLGVVIHVMVISWLSYVDYPGQPHQITVAHHDDAE